ncbi:neuropeptide FF receptor 2-like [Hydractinia symbiolongicarpus]|uniref:neuropeptide FF receptor 2-like n=1 Tax=Hydractinia symbiolongicarpus TaxID=13093 RepID=UPI0025512DBB|nr:neuropeptide FF receptor 2-like [Hydractinia symbiolongicarpus]
MDNTTITAINEQTGITVTIMFTMYYCIVFLSGLIGNVLILIAVLKFKHMKTVFNGFLANLAITDILFVLFSIFNAVDFYVGEWEFGEVWCRVQGTFIEASYTISVLTLVAVAVERYVSICYPHKRKRTFKQSLYMSAALWMIAFIFCSPLFYGYFIRLEETSGQTNKKSKKICANDNWSKKSRLIFYVVHSVLIYLLPLTVMCISHYRISKVLIRQKKVQPNTLGVRNKNTGEPNNGSTIGSTNTRKGRLPVLQRSQQRNIKKRINIIKLFLVVTGIFFILWTPFIVIRLAKYFNTHVHVMIWRTSQLLILATAAVNWIIYALISPSFKKTFKCILAFDFNTNSTCVMNETTRVGSIAN